MNHLVRMWGNPDPVPPTDSLCLIDWFEASQIREPPPIVLLEGSDVSYKLNQQDKGFGLRYESTVEQSLREIAAEIDKDLSLGASEMLYAALNKAVMARKTFIHAGYKKVED